MEIENWLRGLEELTHIDADPKRLADASRDMRICEDPDDVQEALTQLFESEVMEPVFSQFMDPSGFYLNAGLPVSMIIAAAHPSTPVEILKQLASTLNAYVAWALSTNPKTPQEELIHLYTLDLIIPDPISGDEMVYESWDYPGFEDPSSASEWPANFVSVRCAIASNRHLPDEVFDAIVDNGTTLELVALSSSLTSSQPRQLSPTQWERLFSRVSRSYDDSVTWGRLLMLKPSWPIDICIRLLSSENLELSTWAQGIFGCNDACPTHVIRELAASSGQRGRWAAASNRSSPQDVLLSLAMDDEPLVRAALLANPSAPPEARTAAMLLGTDDY